MRQAKLNGEIVWKDKTPRFPSMNQGQLERVQQKMEYLNIDNEDIAIVKICAYLGSVISSSKDCSQKIKKRLVLRRAAMEELGRITKSKDVLRETKAIIMHTLPIPNYYVQMQKLDRG